MKFGAATLAAKKYGAKEIVDAGKYAIGAIKTAMNYYKVGKALPALGYSKKEVEELQRIVNLADCDLVISGTPTDLRRIIKVNKLVVQVTYELAPKGRSFDNLLADFISKATRY